MRFIAIVWVKRPCSFCQMRTSVQWSKKWRLIIVVPKQNQQHWRPDRVARQVWKAPMPVIGIVWVFFVIINVIIFAANLVKVASGGWFVILIAAGLCIMILAELQKSMSRV